VRGRGCGNVSHPPTAHNNAHDPPRP